MSSQLSQVQSDPSAQSWMTIDELKRIALSSGCVLDEFIRAAKMMGSHPLRIARYLKRHSFVPATFEIPQGGHFHVDPAAPPMTAAT